MRAIIVVIDGFGIGALPDAKSYQDEGSNTLLNISASYAINVPTLTKLGLFNINGINQATEMVEGSFARIRPLSIGKDTTVGHWEITGVITKASFPIFPNGFGSEFVNKLCKSINVDKVLLNKPYSGTDAIAEYGDEHCKTGYPILYTSADSVLQIAACVDVVPLQTLYDWCIKARELCVGTHQVGRVIARPFTKLNGKYVRTSDRKDYAVVPPHNLLNELSEANIKVVAIGKIGDIFCNSGITVSFPVHSNTECVNETINQLKQSFDGLIFVNLVETDSLYGHRRDIVGYAQALEEVDANINKLIKNMDAEDVLYITSDHGCDPTHTLHTDHTREYVPLLVYGDSIASVNLETIVGLDSIADTIRHQLLLKASRKSFLNQITK